LILGTILPISERIIKALEDPVKTKLTRLGSDYGGWHIIEGVLSKGDVVISAGAGEDITFDVELARRNDCCIHIFDPTPRAASHFRMLKDTVDKGLKAPVNNSDSLFYQVSPEVLGRIKFHAQGLWKSDREMKFFEPANKAHVSHSIHNMHRMNTHFIADCQRLSSIMRDHELDNVQLLKMDIEGAEYGVLRNLLLSKLRPKMILVEFHARKNSIESKCKLKLLFHILWLRLAGYRLIHRELDNYAFLLEQEGM
jgi:FkbM family methyltransferase